MRKFLVAAACVSLAGHARAVSPAGAALSVRWTVYAGPGAVVFADAAQAATSATFHTPGTYTLELSAADGVHAVAYGAVRVTVGGPAPGK